MTLPTYPYSLVTNRFKDTIHIQVSITGEAKGFTHDDYVSPTYATQEEFAEALADYLHKTELSKVTADVILESLNSKFIYVPLPTNPEQFQS